MDTFLKSLQVLSLPQSKVLGEGQPLSRGLPQSVSILGLDSGATHRGMHRGAECCLFRRLLAADRHWLPHRVPQTAVPRGAQGAELQEELRRHLPFSGEVRFESQSWFVFEACACV